MPCPVINKCTVPAKSSRQRPANRNAGRQHAEKNSDDIRRKRFPSVGHRRAHTSASQTTSRSLRPFLPRDALQCKARSCGRMSSVCPSVTLVNNDHIGRKTSKLTAQTISSASSLFVAQSSSTYSDGNMEKFWGENVRSTPTPITSS